MSTDKYKAASIKVDVTVDAYESTTETTYGAHRSVNLALRQVFKNDDELEAAVESFSKMIIEAARR